MIPVIICIGTESVVGDSLGPIVGTLLKEKYRLSAFVYGSEGNAVHAKNLRQTVSFVREIHGDSPIVAVDACLGRQSDVGRIKLREGGVRAGRATKKNLGTAGDIGVLGIVASTSTDITALQTLLSVSAFKVNEMADKIAFMLSQALC